MSLKVYGSENSPYSIKVRSYCRYKGIPHEWLIRSKNEAGYKKVAKLPIVPAVAFPNGRGMQDSTPIMEELEKQYPGPPAHPAGVALRFIDELLEEFGDEWGNKWMFHFRWAREVDQRVVAGRLAGEMAPNAKVAKMMATQIQKRMAGRGFAVGSNEKTAPLIERDFELGIQKLDAHLASRPYLFGGRPSFADFGLGLQVQQALIDPTAGGIIKAKAPRVAAWCERMVAPQATTAPMEGWETLRPTLLPFLRDHVRAFLTWSVANAGALGAKRESMEVDLGGHFGVWSQTVGGPQKYHKKSLAELRKKYAAAQGDAELGAILDACGCRSPLAAAAKL